MNELSQQLTPVFVVIAILVIAYFILRITARKRGSSRRSGRFFRK